MKKLLVLGLLFLSQSVFAQDIYRLETTIGNNVFGDLLVVDSYGNHSFEGSLTVPGVFTSKVEEGVLIDKGAGKEFRFQIKVHENSEDYLVQYKLDISLAGFVTGVLMKDGEVMATIKGTQLYGDKK